jgi:hypothetical protein
VAPRGEVGDGGRHGYEQGQRRSGCQLIIQSALMRGSAIGPGTHLGARTHTNKQRLLQEAERGRTRRGGGRLRRGRGRELGSSHHVAMRERRLSPMEEAESGRRAGIDYSIARCSDGIGRGRSALGAPLHSLDVCVGASLTLWAGKGTVARRARRDWAAGLESPVPNRCSGLRAHPQRPRGRHARSDWSSSQTACVVDALDPSRR